MNRSLPSNQLPTPIPRDQLAFDIDGVVADIMTTFLTLARERYNQGHHLRVEHITTFMLSECLDLPTWIIDELIRELIDRPHELPVAPFPQAVPVLTRLAQETPLLFVTARDRRSPIEHWLYRNLAEVPPAAIRVLATGDPDTKIHYLKDHNIRYFVEDRLETCLQLADHGITPIVFAQPWNRHPHPFPEVPDWLALEGLLFEKD
ncbi:MAG: 5' nucleotidase, NT5C type [Thermodesulfobacteriota bacterium]